MDYTFTSTQVFDKHHVPEELRQTESDNKIIYHDALIDAAMQTTEDVEVFKHRNFAAQPIFLGFEPKKNVRGVGIIIYPGAFVKAEAYAPLAKALSQRGFHAAITSPVFKFQLFKPWQGKAVLEYKGWKNHPRAFTIAGHSAGGVAAAMFADEDSTFHQKLAGLVLLASYPDDRTDLSSQTDLKVVSVHGTKDALTTQEKIDNSKSLLPADTNFVRIEGGNHTQFYAAREGFVQQPTRFTVGDNPADILYEMQLSQVVEACCSVMEDIAAEIQHEEDKKSDEEEDEEKKEEQ